MLLLICKAFRTSFKINQWAIIKQSQPQSHFNVLLSCHSQSIYRLKKACHGELDEDCNLLTPDQVVDRIFELVDENGDGECFQQFSDSLVEAMVC